MLVDPQSVSLATYFMPAVQQQVERPLTPDDLSELRVSLAEAIQGAVEDWFKDLPEMLAAGKATR